jgi:hypothetical protein
MKNDKSRSTYSVTTNVLFVVVATAAAKTEPFILISLSTWLKARVTVIIIARARKEENVHLTGFESRTVKTAYCLAQRMIYGMMNAVLTIRLLTLKDDMVALLESGLGFAINCC